EGDSAVGDVVMIPTGYGQPLVRWRDPAVAPATRPQSEVLTINFVRVEGGRVSGTLAPYADPQTGARLITTFAGELKGSTIDGTYTTQLPSGGTQQGRWTVQRKQWSSRGRTRTCDPPANSRRRYQLSYAGTRREA